MKHSFVLGAIGYPVLELMYRGRTHYSMAIAGGCAAWLANRLHGWSASLAVRSAVCALGITGIEYACGCIWNKHYTVWDYRNMPLHYRGQICLPYTLLWCGLSAALMKGLDYCDKGSRT